MQHTYLRYECADTFSLSSSVPSSSSNSTQVVDVLSSSSSSSGKNENLVLTLAGSQCVAFDVRSGNPPRPFLKLGHVDESSNVGSGRALNPSECTCLDVLGDRVGTGWIDGAVRVFRVRGDEGTGVVNSLLTTTTTTDHTPDEPPLVLHGHSRCPVTCVSFDRDAGRLASGGADGSVVVWDVVAETGLFRLLGHHKTVTSLAFVRRGDGTLLDGLLSTALDGLVKVWDLDAQCCAQTVAGHRGEVWTADTAVFRSTNRQDANDNDNNNNDNNDRWRMVTGASDNQLRVYAVHAPRRADITNPDGDIHKGIIQIIPPSDDSTTSNAIAKADELVTSPTDAPQEQPMDDALTYMGSLKRRTNERASLVRFYPQSNLLGVAAHQSKDIEIYSVRSVEESEKKRVRRLRRRREKANKRANKPAIVVPTTKGMLDDDDDVGMDDKAEMDDDKEDGPVDDVLSPEGVCASDEFDFLGVVRASHKVRGFVFARADKNKRGGAVAAKLIVSLATNALEVHSIKVKTNKEDGNNVLETHKMSTLDQYGHPTGIRAVSLSPTDDKYATTISKGMLKVWSVPSRSCIRSLPLHYSSDVAVYALCCAFLPSNSHVVVGTREGHVLILDVASGDVVFLEEKAHNGAVWALDVKSDGSGMVTGSADHTVKFWEFEAQEEDGNNPGLVHTRTLEMKDDVVAVRYSYSHEKKLVLISSLDCTIQVFFEDNLKLFLNLYGHKLPALGMDCSDDDAILATGGADKTIKLWGLDFGDVHKTLYGHTDSITDIKFVRKTHNFFSCGRDKTVRYWDGDRFDGILVLYGHTAEVNSLAISKTGAFVLSAGMDRQVRVWERTKDMVFIDEEKDREVERLLDQADGSRGEKKLSMKVMGAEDDEEDDEQQPQSAAAVRRSVLSVASGDRIMEAIELADFEMKDIASRKNKKTQPNPMLLGKEPYQYMLWVLRTVKSAELEQSLLVLPLNHMERLMFYLIVLLRKGMGVEICAKVAVFLVKTHQNQIIATHTLSTPLRELRRLIKNRVGECRDTVGYNLVAMKAVGRFVQERNSSFFVGEDDKLNTDVWAGLGLGSDVAAALEGRDKKRVKR